MDELTRFCTACQVEKEILHVERVAAKHPVTLDHRFVHLGTEKKER